MITALFLSLIMSCQTQLNVPEHIQNISVVVKCHDKIGSGIIKIRDDSVYIWTCAHLLRDGKHVVEGKDKKKTVTFDHPKITKELYEQGDLIGKVEIDTEVIKCSEVADLALLKVIGKNIRLKDSVTFGANNGVKVGEELWHCGNLFGDKGINSVSRGVLSYKDRQMNNNIHWQSTCVVFPGSSGGGIFLKDGKCIGLVTSMAQSNLNFFTPVSKIRAWANEAGVLFAVDDNVPVPSAAQLKKKEILQEEQKMNMEDVLKEIFGK